MEMWLEETRRAKGYGTNRGFIVLLDEVYIGIESKEHISLLNAALPALFWRICLVLSASKGLGAMPGARAAWVTCGDASIVLEMAKIQSCASGNASTISQIGLEAALRHCLLSPDLT
jgi:aspartate/methionine/tyrosine aminotransferase